MDAKDRWGLRNGLEKKLKANEGICDQKGTDKTRYATDRQVNRGKVTDTMHKVEKGRENKSDGLKVFSIGEHRP